MTEPEDLDTLLDFGLDSVLGMPKARRRIAEQLPDVVVDRLFRSAARDRARLRVRLVELWDEVSRERGSYWQRGWSELTSGLAVCIEVVAGELPTAVADTLRGTPAESLFHQSRRRFQRFALLVDDQGSRPTRIVARATPRRCGEPVERSVPHACEEAFTGRSHTLLLALIADGRISPGEGPTAATGELADDGERVLPVDCTLEKAGAWWARHPGGLLISSPPRDVQLDDVRRLFEKLGHDSVAKLRWISGTSLGEIDAKMKPRPPITGWGGAVLDDQTTLDARLSAPAENDRAAEGWRSPRVSSDPLLEAVWEVFARGERSRGVVIRGRPGVGKSVLSRVIEERFALGALSPLGFGVRCSARDIARLLDERDVGWASALGRAQPERSALFAGLEAEGRLVPIIDGLDELRPPQAVSVSTWLARGRGLWIATSRALHGVGLSLPPHRVLEHGPLDAYGAQCLLTALGREDLAVAIADDSRRALRAMLETPLLVILLAAVVKPGSALSELSLDELYARAFRELISHACASGRLKHDDSEFLQRRLPEIGRLAMTWLASPTGYIDDQRVEGIGADDEPRFFSALQFGQLLVPAGHGWEFCHRTLAEWAAARCLRGEVEKARSVQSPIAGLERAFAGDLLPSRGPWAMVLTFYADHLSAPLALVERVLGPRHLERWRVVETPVTGPRGEWGASTVRAATVRELLDEWGFVFELLGRCRHWDRADACAVWAFAVRRWILDEPDGDRAEGHGRAVYQPEPRLRGWRRIEPPESARRLMRIIGDKLPESIEALAGLAARTSAQAETLARDILVLLPLFPPARASLLEPVLRAGDRDSQRRILGWYRDSGMTPPLDLVRGLAEQLPRDLDQLSDAWDVPEETRELRSLLSDLETIVWGLLEAHDGEPPWVVLRSRFLEAPAHLEEHLARWFAAEVETSRYRPRAGVDHRRELMTGLLVDAAERRHGVSTALADIADDRRRALVIARVVRLLDDSNDGRIRADFWDLVASRGWTRDGADGWSPIEDDTLANRLRDGLRELQRSRQRIVRLIEGLTRDALDAIVGGAWSLLPPDSGARAEVLTALDRLAHVPRSVPPMAVVKRRREWDLGGLAWTPEQLEVLRQAACDEWGEARFGAIQALSAATKVDVNHALAAALGSGDEDLDALIYTHLNRGASEVGGTLLVVPAPERLSLQERVRREIAGWRLELLATLAEPAARDGRYALVELVLVHGVREALPLLASRLGDDPDAQAVEVIAILADDRDDEYVHAAIAHALRCGAWPRRRSYEANSARCDASQALARHLRLGDLEALTERGTSALAEPAVRAALRTLGSPARERLFARLGEVRARLASLRSTPRAADSGPSGRSSGSADTLKRACRYLEAAIITVVDPTTVPLAELVSLLFEVAGVDEIEVSASPGPLGADFDEPADRDWYSTTLNEDVVAVAKVALDTCLGAQPMGWQALLRLFGHPSAFLRLHAYELCASRVEDHERARLALKALEAHFCAPSAHWSGDTTGLFLASTVRGTGSMDVDAPEAGRRLAAAVRRHLTQLDRPLVEQLTRHPTPQLRVLAARWAGELGTKEWAGAVRWLLADEEPLVAMTALDALASLDGAGVDDALAGLDLRRWTPSHHRGLLERVRGTLAASQRFGQASRVRIGLGYATLLRFLAEAGARALNADQAGDWFVDPCLTGDLTLVEQVLRDQAVAPGPELLELFRDWSAHPNCSVRGAGRRLLAERQALGEEELVPVLASPDRHERVSAAECIVRLGVDSLRGPALAVLDDGVAPSRVLWALVTAPPSFIDVLGVVAHSIPIDYEDGGDTSVGAEIVAGVLCALRRWGPECVGPALALLDRGAVQDDERFVDALEELCEARPETWAVVRSAAASGGTASRALVARHYDRDVARLREWLAGRIFAPQS